MAGEIVRLSDHAPAPRRPAKEELERTVVGGVLALGDAGRLIESSGLTPTDFGDLVLRQVWTVAKTLARLRQPVTAQTVWAAGAAVHMFTERDGELLLGLESGNLLSLEAFHTVSISLWRLNRAGDTAGQLEQMAARLRQGTFRHDEVPTQLREIGQNFDRTFSTEQTGADAVIELLTRINERNEGKVIKADRMPTRVALMDEAMGGFPSDFCGFLGQPGEGKSAVIGMIIRAQLEADPDLRLAYFPLEGGAIGLIRRMLAGDAEISLRQLGEKMSPELAAKVNDLGPYLHTLFQRLIVFNWSRATAGEICQRARMLKRKYGVAAVYLDTLSKVDHKGKPGARFAPNEEVAESIYAFGDLARSEDIPFVAAIHTNRPDSKKESAGQKEERPPLLHEAAKSADIDREIRCAWGVWRKAGEFRATFLKMNEERVSNSGGAVTIEFSRLENSPILLAEGGKWVNLKREASEEKREKQKEADAVSDIRALERKARRAKLDVEEKPAEDVKGSTEEPPQLDLIPPAAVESAPGEQK